MSQEVEDQAVEERLYGEDAAEELDTEDGTPSEDADEAEDDGTSATGDAGEKDSDTDDGTPDDDEEGEAGFEQRYKDTQASLTQVSQELADLKSEQVEQAGVIAETQLELQGRLEEVEEVATFYSQMADANLVQLRQQNVQGMTQEQYAQWQQNVGLAHQQSQVLKQRLGALQQHSKQAKDDALGKTVKIARAQLLKSIDNFDEVYPEIGKFAVSQGATPAAFKEITDPGLIKILHRAMEISAAPDAIDKVVKKTQNRRKMPSARKAAKPAPKTLADKLYGS